MDAAQCRDFPSLQYAADWLCTAVQDGDLVFLKGRGTDHLSRILFAQFGAIGCWKSSCSFVTYATNCKPNSTSTRHFPAATDRQ